jgi:hypothetical protein
MNFTYGESEIEKIAVRFGLSYKQCGRGVTGNLKAPKPSHSFRHYLCAVGKIQVSTAECERGFGRMNLLHHVNFRVFRLINYEFYWPSN